MTPSDDRRRSAGTRRACRKSMVRTMLAALAIAAIASSAVAAEDVTFTLKNCARDQKKIDVQVYDRVDEIRMFAISGWNDMTYQQIIGFRCVRRRPSDPNECSVKLTVQDGGTQDYWVVHGAAESFCWHEPTRRFFVSSCGC